MLLVPSRSDRTRLAALVAVAVVVAGCLPSTLAGRGPKPEATEPPVAIATHRPTPAPTTEATPEATAVPAPTAEPSATPLPSPEPVDVNLVDDPKAHFITEVKKTWCAASATQMVLVLNDKVALTQGAQAALIAEAKKYWTWNDSHNRGWGPTMMAKVLAAHGVTGYEVRTYKTRAAALLDAAKAIEDTGQPALLLVWRGAHAWVATGFRATADPAVYDDATVTGMYVLDPWYPRVSSIWGRSDAPGTFQDAKEMVRNYLGWKRPEGKYPERDGRFVAVVPTEPKP